jgi:hypothetical protein
MVLKNYLIGKHKIAKAHDYVLKNVLLMNTISAAYEHYFFPMHEHLPMKNVKFLLLSNKPYNK